MRLPTGTVTFLFTDIEGSTKLWEQFPDAMKAALARHDAILQEAIQQNNGYLVKTTGDGCLAAFHTAPEALDAALTLQHALSTEAWPSDTPLNVRAALHTGAAELRDNDYFGSTLSRAARLLAIGWGGQTLLSTASQELVRDTLPLHITLLDLGQHRLKDLQRPETVFQVAHPHLPRDFPPLRSLDNPALLNNLPQQMTSFIGREAAIEDVKGLLKTSRLLTLTGSGGSGKTRLSLQVAAEMLDGEGDGVWFVELAPLAEDTLVPQTVANVLGVKEEMGKTILQSLVEHLKSKRILILLDNCEHLVNAAAQLADTLLKQCPNIILLATSREVLNIAGETQYRVPPLALPNPKQIQTVESLSQYEAVRLFIARALQAQTSFAVTNENAPALAQLCVQLDGIPLAIELAAARVRSLSVEEINGKLDNRFRLLTGGLRTALPRQQTLRALIDWSYDLLNEQEKAFLCRLSVFAGGWVLAAAEQVGVTENGEDGIEAWEVLALLTSLVDKSLVVADTAVPTRYRLLETMRQYTHEKLWERDDAEATQNRHLAFYVELMTEAKPKMKGADALAWFDRLEAEQDNLRAALAWAITDGKIESGLRIAAVMERFWRVRGPLSEGRAISIRLLNQADASISPVVMANALNGAGILAQFQGDYREALELYERAKALWEEVNDLHGVASTLNNMGMIASALSDWAQSRQVTEEALAINRRISNRQSEAINLNNLGILAMRQQDYATAQTYLETALHINREEGMREWETGNLLNMGMAALLQGEHTRASECLKQALTISREVDYKILIAETLGAFGLLAAQQGQSERAARIWGASEALRETLAAPMSTEEQEEYNRAVAEARQAADPAQFSIHWAEGRSLTMQQAIELTQDDQQE